MTGEAAIVVDGIGSALVAHGLVVRGIANFAAGEGPSLAGGASARSVVLIGNAGGSMWPAFTLWRSTQPDSGGEHPLDRWSKLVVRQVADDIGATAYFPSDEPYQPFQQWAMAAEGLTASPLGILVHPRFGLWHGYRGALGFSRSLCGAKPPEPTVHPCTVCRDKPCLSTCPATAVSEDVFDVSACRSHLVHPEGKAGCMTGGCIARNACPVGLSYRYPEGQIRFHMRALNLPAG